MTSFDGARLVLKRVPFIAMWLNFVFLGLAGLVVEKLNLERGCDAWFFAVFSAVVGLVLGVWVKYRTKFSVQFSLNLACYFLLIGPIIFGGVCAAMASHIAGASDLEVHFLILYLVSMVAPLVFGVLRSLRKISDDKWMRSYGGAVDLDGYIIKPLPSGGGGESDNVRSAIWIAGALTVNVPLFFSDLYWLKE